MKHLGVTTCLEVVDKKVVCRYYYYYQFYIFLFFSRKKNSKTTSTCFFFYLVFHRNRQICEFLIEEAFSCLSSFESLGPTLYSTLEGSRRTTFGLFVGHFSFVIQCRLEHQWYLARESVFTARFTSELRPVPPQC